VKGQVDGAEEVSEPFGARPFVGHATRVTAGGSIVNPDGSPGAGSPVLAADRPGRFLVPDAADAPPH